MFNGVDLRKAPLLDRHDRLQDFTVDSMASCIYFSSHGVGNGPVFFAAADAHKLEGIVSRRQESRYASGRMNSWLKVKTFTIDTYEVVGVERSSTGIPVALLATMGDAPADVGNAMVTLGDAFWRAVEAMETPNARLGELLKNKKAQWVREGLTASVRHLGGADKLRHATLQRVDVAPLGALPGESSYPSSRFNAQMWKELNPPVHVASDLDQAKLWNLPCEIRKQPTRRIVF